MSKELWISGELFERADRGDVESVKELCGLASRELMQGGSIPNLHLVEFVASCLEQIADGISPQQAFFSKPANRPKANNVLRDWEVKRIVQDLMQDGKSWTSACRLAAHEGGGEIGLSAKTIEGICKGLEADTHLPFPDDIFPLGKRVISRSKK